MHINKIELRVQNEEVLLRLISMFGVSVGGTTFISFKTIHCYFDLENDFSSLGTEFQPVPLLRAHNLMTIEKIINSGFDT